MGHVQAQRYLHPTKYRSRFIELAKWMRTYADHPDARRIYKLALKRKPRNYRSPRRPQRKFYPSYQPTTIIEESGYRPGKRSARRIISQRDINVGCRPRRVFSDKTVQRRLGRTGLILRARILRRAGSLRRRKEIQIIREGGDPVTVFYAHWIAGLSAYRLGKYLEAADHFEAVALSPKVTGYDHAAAAFWAARSNMTGERPTRVSRWLKMAAEQSRTFYGIIARRWLGDQSPLDWSPTVLTGAGLERVSAPSGRRATALIQVGRNGAERNPFLVMRRPI